MPRPKNKQELLQLSEVNYRKLLDLVDSYSDEEKESEFPPTYLNRNIRDVLAHLHHWHLLMLGWYQTGMAGDKPDIPAKGYTWKTLPDFNKSIRDKYADEDLNDVRQCLDSSYRDVRHLILRHSDEELFEKKRYKWTGSTSLGAYFISATSSHYDWATKLIKKCMKQTAEKN